VQRKKEMLQRKKRQKRRLVDSNKKICSIHSLRFIGGFFVRHGIPISSENEVFLHRCLLYLIQLYKSIKWIIHPTGLCSNSGMK
jgi:hypothetical protein